MIEYFTINDFEIFKVFLLENSDKIKNLVKEKKSNYFETYEEAVKYLFNESFKIIKRYSKRLLKLLMILRNNKMKKITIVNLERIENLNMLY